MKVMEEVPFIRGLENWLGTDLGQKSEKGRAAAAYLKDMGAATASNGAVGLYHVQGLTPEAKESGDKLIASGAKVYVIDDEELQRVKSGYPCIWKDKSAAPKLCFIGCPHLSIEQLTGWADRILAALAESGRKKLAVPSVFTAAPAVLREFRKDARAAQLEKTGAVLSEICPLMYMNNPLCRKKPVITNSNKLRTYSSARYYTDDELFASITGAGKET
jgi:predicted aconitase